MKSQRIPGKLVLNKKTISQLNGSSLKNAKGGWTGTCRYCFATDEQYTCNCPDTDSNHTITGCQLPPNDPCC